MKFFVVDNRGVFKHKAVELSFFLVEHGCVVRMNEIAPEAETFSIQIVGEDEPMIKLKMQSPYKALVDLNMRTVADMILKP